MRAFEAWADSLDAPVDFDHSLPIDEIRQYHETSWFALLLPIILTTAVVIVGAWRRAVRDAAAEAVGEDE